MNEEKRKFVVEHLYYNGKYRHKLTNEEYDEVFYLADGFGKLVKGTPDANCIGFDWSHVRDSTPKAVIAMYNKLKEMGK